MRLARLGVVGVHLTSCPPPPASPRLGRLGFVYSSRLESPTRKVQSPNLSVPPPPPPGSEQESGSSDSVASPVDSPRRKRDPPISTSFISFRSCSIRFLETRVLGGWDWDWGWFLCISGGGGGGFRLTESRFVRRIFALALADAAAAGLGGAANRSRCRGGDSTARRSRRGSRR